ncbi:MAG: DUF255 domain-containing protein [Candidatus Krumholzibacteria bacterium]|nr:DUF255 domain-containing protein [Candidatus Krumholzibacteria bacterium]
MRKRIMPVLLLAALLAACAEERKDAGPAGGKQAENVWLSYGEGMELARNLGKPVVIDFYTSWCRWCKVMDEKTFSDPRVSSYLAEHFICIRLNAEGRTGALKWKDRVYTPAELTRAFQVQGYPSLAYIDDGGDLVLVDPGFKEPGPFMQVLEYVRSGCHEKGVTLDQYRRNGGRCG